MIYDVIIGEILPTKYDYNYVKGSYVNRIQLDEITDYRGLVELINESLKDYSLKSTEQIDTLLNVSSEFNILKGRLDSGEDIENVDETIRELLSALAYTGFDLYIIRRPDLESATLDDNKTRAYMIDKQDTLFPTINRVVNGRSLVFDETRDANISTVVMEFLTDIHFNDIVEDAVSINSYREQFEALEESNMGWALNTDRLIQFLSDYGYKFVVVV